MLRSRRRFVFAYRTLGHDLHLCKIICFESSEPFVFQERIVSRQGSNWVYKSSDSRMKHTRIVVTHYGGPDALQVIQEECPEPRQGEVRVKVLAAGVALPDVMA